MLSPYFTDNTSSVLSITITGFIISSKIMLSLFSSLLQIDVGGCCPIFTLMTELLACSELGGSFVKLSVFRFVSL